MVPRGGLAPRPAPARCRTDTPGDWLVIGEGDADAGALAGILQEAGARTEVWDPPLGDEQLGPFGDRVGTHLAPPRGPW